jgi:flavin reductase (DIM6/NTAB) family NADH-FMN oxidoreductase RutF
MGGGGVVTVLPGREHRRHRQHGDPATTDVDLRAAMQHHAAGVAVITADGHELSGFTASSVVSLSLDPPLLAFSVALGSQAWQAWRRAVVGTVHLLHEGQAEVSAFFADPRRDRFDGTIPWHWSEDAGPVLDDALVWLTVSPRDRFLTGDHATVVCLVTSVRTGRLRRPLVLHGGGYTTTVAQRAHRHTVQV